MKVRKKYSTFSGLVPKKSPDKETGLARAEKGVNSVSEHRVAPGCSGRSRPAKLAGHSGPCRISLVDLIKATLVCGIVAFLFYSYPVLGQIVAIAVLSLLWLSYARKTIVSRRARRLA